MSSKIRLPLILALALASASLIMPVAAHAQAGPLPPEKHPPGDIPDSQVFVVHQSPLGFALKVPEGWARRVTPEGVSFASAYDGVAVGVTHSAAAPSVESVKREQAVALRKSPAAVRITKIAAVRLPAGPAVLVSYSSNSAPNPVTGKAIRLENEQYLFWKDGKLATLTLYAPYGADNVDQWRLMSRSFRWR